MHYYGSAVAPDASRDESGARHGMLPGGERHAARGLAIGADTGAPARSLRLAPRRAGRVPGLGCDPSYLSGSRPGGRSAADTPRSVPAPWSSPPPRRRSLGYPALAALTALLGVALLAPSLASAAFTRPFLRQITGTSSGKFTAPRGIAVDAGGNLWVTEPVGRKAGVHEGETFPPFPLDQFAAAELGSSFLEALEIEPTEASFTRPESLAIDQSTGSFYVTGPESTERSSGNNSDVSFVEIFDSAGAFEKRFGPFDRASSVAIDNSTDVLEDPSGCSPGCSVYVTREATNSGVNEGETGAIEKFSEAGMPVDFGEAGNQTYVSGNRITGVPGQIFESGAPASMTVDAHGDIYAVNVNSEDAIVDEFEPSGKFVRAFTGLETPGLGGSHTNDGFGGALGGVAVDPVSGHLLVSVNGRGPKDEGNGEVAAIDEFAAEGPEVGKFVGQITESDTGRPLQYVGAITVDAKGDVYLVETGVGGNGPVEGASRAVDLWGPGASKPSFKLAEAADRQPTSVLLSGSVDPEGLSLSACEFEYVPQRQFEETKFASVTAAEKASCSPEAAKVPVDSDYHAVQAEVTGLAQGGTYYYRLSGTTAGSTGGFSESVSLAFTTPAAPRVLSASAANISDTSVELVARIDPVGAATSYHFEYSSNGVAWVSTPEVGVGQGAPTGSVVASVVRQVAPLLPGTTYAFRVVAQNAYGSAPGGPGAEGSFTTLPLVGEGLPDGRAYEMLTPPDKGSAEDMFAQSNHENEDVGYPSGSGEEFLFEAGFAAFGTEEHPFAGSGDNIYVFRRTGGGWQTVPLASPLLGVQSLATGV